MRRLTHRATRQAQRFAACLLPILALAACGAGEEPAADPVPEEATPPPEWAELLPNARLAQADVLTGGQPSREQLERAAELGFRTVVNLRQPDEYGSESPRTVERLGMTYLALPIDGAEELTPDNARELVRVLEGAERPVMLHCGSGNRVGGLLAVAAYHVEGATAEEALAYGRATGLTRLEPAVRQLLESAER